MEMQNMGDLKSLFDYSVAKYNSIDFIDKDPISIPHRYTKKQDIEIAGFFAAIFAWGQRTTIINKASEVMQLMGNTPHDFVVHHSENDLKPLTNFVHRTFNGTDLLFFIKKLSEHYSTHDSLEDAFLINQTPSHFDMYASLTNFHHYLTDDDLCLPRTRKHIANPEKGSTCKRLLMYLRWMVRKDDTGVDFGIWNRIPMNALMIPYDLHVDRIARKYNLLDRPQKDWKTVVELTNFCRTLDPLDPAKYDYALFGLSVNSGLEED
jgi:uncharacterized protein (TIGR02757 family)